jgi:lipid-A-disaccharide synthase
MSTRLASLPEPLRLLIVAGEHSGDRLGGKLLEVLKQRLPGQLSLAGVGGDDMVAQGLPTLFPMHEIAVMGIGDVLKRVPDLLRRIDRVAAAGLAFDPHAIVLIDAPDFTHRVARRIRKVRPDIPIINYVSPTVWAWRPGRAKAMAAYVDHVLALLPFEPAAHQRLGGPACTYVGHPIVERLDWMRALDVDALAARLGVDRRQTILTVLPGSRRSEIKAMMPIFGDVIRRIETETGPLQLILPLVESVAPLVEAGLATWPRRPHIVTGEADKFAAFRLGTAALACSGTVTLELAAAGSPMAVGYIAKGLTALVQPFIKIQSVILANLVLGRNVFPEFIQRACTVDNLTGALAPLLLDTPERRAQLAGLAEIPHLLAPPASSPSAAAADIVLAMAQKRRVR